MCVSNWGGIFPFVSLNQPTKRRPTPKTLSNPGTPCVACAGEFLLCQVVEEFWAQGDEEKLLNVEAWGMAHEQQLGPGSALLPFFGGGFLTKIDYRKKGAFF